MKDTPPDGVIRIEVDKISKDGYASKMSPEIVVKGVPWKVMGTVNDTINAILICGHNQSTPFSIGFEAKFTLVHPENGENITLETSYVYKNTVHSIGYRICRSRKGIEKFMKDDKLTIEVRFWISEMKGIKFTRQVDFTDPDEPFHDVALLIEGEKIYASKQILAVCSPVFKAMFYGDFAEKNKKEIELKGVIKEEFIELLRVIYPSNRKIRCYSLHFLLKLGDRFDIECVLDSAEEFLIDDSLANLTKMRLADKYGLYALKEHVFSYLKTIEDFTAIEESPEFGRLSDQMKADLREHKTRIEA